MTPDQVGGRLWAQPLKRLFGIETCWTCGGAVRIIASIEDPVVIQKILTHLDAKLASAEASGCRRAGHRAKRGCSTEPSHPVSTSHGCDAGRRGGVAIGLAVGAR